MKTSLLVCIAPLLPSYRMERSQDVAGKNTGIFVTAHATTTTLPQLCKHGINFKVILSSFTIQSETVDCN